MNLWRHSFSGLFEEYVRSHPGLDVDLSNEKDVADLNKDFVQWHMHKTDTIADLDRHGLMF